MYIYMYVSPTWSPCVYILQVLYNINIAHMSPVGSYVDPVASNSQKETDLSVTERITKN